jgi:hypothetical protein
MSCTPAPFRSHFGVNFVDVHMGNFAAFFMATGLSDSVSQSIVTVPGGVYTGTFWLANDENSDMFNAMFGATSLLSLLNAAPFSYTEYSQNVTATSASTLLVFSGAAPVDTLFLDDVSVVQAAVPEPHSLALLVGALLVSGVVRRRLWVA